MPDNQSFSLNGENVDYVTLTHLGEPDNQEHVVFTPKGENSKGGRPTIEYALTISCLEYFIARKVRPVFVSHGEISPWVYSHSKTGKTS